MMNAHSMVARSWPKRLFFLSLILVMVVNSSCNFPLPGQPTPTAQPTAITVPTTPPTPIPTVKPTETKAEPLPPALVEAEPAPLSEIGPKTALTFYFNQSMDHGAVQEALQSQPPLSGSFQWLDSATVKFTPDKSLPMSTDFAISFSTKARASNGLALSDTIQVKYRTSGGFSLADQLPRPGSADVDPSAALVATFTRPVVALGADPASLPTAFTIEPAAKGRSEWLNTSTFIFYPDPPLLGGSDYTVRLNANLTGADGTSWAAEAQLADWKFKTARPSLLAVKPDQKAELLLDAPLVFTFNQPMDPASVQQNLTIKAANGEVVTGKSNWNDAGTELSFQPASLLKRATKYAVSLSGKAQSRGGATLGKDFAATYTTVPDFGVRSSEPANGGTLQLYDVYGGIRIVFTAPLAKQDLTGKLTLQPAVGDPYISQFSDSEVYLSGIFAYHTAYTLTLQAGIQDKWGQALKEPVVIRFQSPVPQPSLTLTALMGDGITFITPRDTALSGNATNLKTLHIETASLNLAQFAQAASIYSYERGQKYNGPKPAAFDKRVTLPVDRNSAVNIPLTPAEKAQPTGLYFYRLSSPEITAKNNQSPSSVLVVVSRVHLALKRSQNQLTAWAVNLETNQPVTNTPIVMYTSDKNGTLSQVGEGKTDGQGIGRVDYPFSEDMYLPVYVTIGKPGDPNFSLSMTSWTQGVSSYDFGFPVDTHETQIHAYLYTDRAIYRPGQEVNFRALIHKENNGRYEPSNLKQVTVVVRGEFSRTTGDQVMIFKNGYPLSDYGSLSGTFQLPDTVSPGYYSLELSEVPNTALSFQVANYRKPEVDLQATFSSADYKAGQDFNASLQTRYYFGAVAGNLNLHWALYSSPTYFSLPEGYQNGPIDNDWLYPRGFITDLNTGLGRLIAEGQVRTAPDGKAAVTVPAKKWIDAVDETHVQHLTLEVTLQDEQEQTVSYRTVATVHPADLYNGIKPDAWSGNAKAIAGFSVQTYDWKRAVVGNRKLTALFQKVTYRQKTDWNWQSGTAPFTMETTRVGSTDFQVDAQGRARIAFTPTEPGTYLIEVNGDGAISQILFWVGGEGRALWPAMPQEHIRLVADADSYKAGQTAKIFIPNPLGEKTLAWITVERAKVIQSTVVPINGSSLEWTLPVDDSLAPNVYIGVMLLNSAGGTAPDFRSGYLELKVEPTAFTLNVSVKATPQTAAPGSEVRLGIQVKDAQGKPVQGEFSLAVVDKAVLALADPNAEVIQEAFYGRNPLGVTTSLPLAVYGAPRREAAPTAAAIGGRGGGGGNFEAPVIRSDFRDTAYWSGMLVTGADGTTEVPVRLPDNLTTWVVTARGLSRDLRVGEGTGEVTVGKDLLVRPVTPRFVVAGDRVQLAALVNNNTANALSVNVTLQTTGLELENPAQASQKIDLLAQGRAKVSWWAKVQNVDKVELVFSAKGGGLEDSSRPTNGNLPVLNYSTPQTFGTGGLLAEAGERLEVISAPRSFNPTGGQLKVELSPSLAASVLSGLKALESFPFDVVEPVMSRLLANLETYQALQKLGIDSADLKAQLQTVIQESVSRIVSWQNQDGGWGWNTDQASDPYLSAYILFGVSEAVKAGIQVDAAVVKKAGDYLTGLLITPTTNTQVYQLDRLAFQHFSLQQAGRGQKTAATLYDFRERLSPWAQALLALTLNGQDPADERARSLITNLQSQALRSATGAHWETKEGAALNLGTPVFSTAVVSLALAHLDPASAVLTDAVRFLSFNRRPNGCWASSYESTWVMMALTDVMRGTGELSASFAYSALLNNAQVLKGQAGGPNALTAVETSIPLSNLRSDNLNSLKIVHDTGAGRLYYRTFLQVNRPVEQVLPLNRGLSIARETLIAGQDCTKKDCQPVSSVKIGDQQELLVQVSLTLPQAMYHLVVEDYIPAGAEIVDASLKTAQRGGQSSPEPVIPYQVANPFGSGWNWWLFGAPKVYDDHIRWTAPYLAAGTYVLTYRLTPLQAGEYRVLPAHAYENYFPEVEGSSAGAIFRIDP